MVRRERAVVSLRHPRVWGVGSVELKGQARSPERALEHAARGDPVIRASHHHMDGERGTFKVNGRSYAGREIKGLIRGGLRVATMQKFWAAHREQCCICSFPDHIANEAFIFSAEILGTDLGQAGR